MIKDLPIEAECTGCGACSNVCPVNAISMTYSPNGFLVPSIDSKCIECGLCVKTCSVLNTRYENSPTPKFYSFCASDEIRKVSSSGGIFTMLSDYVFANNGYVCGAAFDDDFQLKHIIVDNKDALAPLKGSKYLQSNVGNCYKEIKQLLEDGKQVFFCGTPCQVAGLYGVLKKDYENLITADLLCSGVPSQKFLDSYLENVSAGRKVKSVNFRDKRYGWNCNHIVTQFDDGTERVGATNRNDPYMAAFHKKLMLRSTCSNCKFADYPRQGDFTIGDLWESGKLDPNSNDKKGTSFVFVNNEKAAKIFDEISAKAKYVNEIKVDDDKYSAIPNRVTPKGWINPNRERFLDLVKVHPFTKAVNQSLKYYYDIGLPSVLYGPNIGSVLTYFAMYHVLTDLGYTVLPIEKPQDASLANYKGSVEFVSKWLPKYSQPVQYKNLLEMRRLNNKCGMFVIGSDQIYLQSMSNERGDIYFLQYINGNKRKIGYSVSFGGPGARGNKDYYDTLKYHLNKFQHISCREDNGVAFANDQLKLEPTVKWTLDPVFLCNKDRFMELIQSVNVERESEYLGVYLLKPRDKVVDLINDAREHFENIPIECIGNVQAIKNLKNFPYECKSSFPIENALEMMYNSKFIITDSFHGMCFSIIFRKDFITMPRDFPDRFMSILKRLGLEDRIISPDFENFNEEWLKPIDYDAVYEKLEALKKDSFDFLLSALSEDRVPLKFNDVDMAMDYIYKQQSQIDLLKAEVDKLNAEVQKVNKAIPKAKPNAGKAAPKAKPNAGKAKPSLAKRLLRKPVRLIRKVLRKIIGI